MFHLSPMVPVLGILRSSKSLLPVLVVVLLLAGPLPLLRAAITTVGEVEPTDPTTWTFSSTTAYIGNTASGTLTVNNDSDLLSSYAYIGNGSGSIGEVTVDGSGSRWSNKNGLYIGNSGTGSLAITNGGLVQNYETYIGYNSGSSGTVTISGAGSALATEAPFLVGGYGSGSLAITNGGIVNTGGENHNGSLGNVYVGWQTGSTATVTVSGSGSTWTMDNHIYVGYNGNGTLAINSGGAVNVTGTTITGTNGTIDFGTGGGTLVTAGLITAWSNLKGTGVIQTKGFLGDLNLTFDGSSIWSGTFGTAGTATIDTTATSRGNGLLGAGYAGTGTLTIKNGAKVGSAADNSSIAGLGGCLGYSTGSSGVATVSGSGSTWYNGGCFCVGYKGSGSLAITSGGVVKISHDIISGHGYSSATIGYMPGSSGTVTVDGAGSAWTWSYSDNLFIGDQGSGVLSIKSGGFVSNVSGGGSVASYIGNSSGSSGTVTVSGSGSKWVNSDLYVGNSGSGTLMINGGGSVGVGGTAYIACAGTNTGTIDFGAGGGTLTTDGLITAWSNLKGTGIIQTGGIVSDLNLTFDGNTTWSGTFGTAGTATIDASITGGGGALGVGYAGASTLTVENGTKVRSRRGYLGYLTGSLGTALVSGSGSTWINKYDLYVGNKGSGALSITAGGAVNDQSAYVGYNNGSSGTVTVDGGASLWSNSGSVYVGSSGNGMMSITNGGSVIGSADAYVGYNNGSSGAVTVNGGASLWSNSGSIYVGSSGNGMMSITNGGSVIGSAYAYVGYNSGSSGTVTVDGAGSTWLNTGIASIRVGGGGTGTLNITNGGAVGVPDAAVTIGYQSGSVGVVKLSDRTSSMTALYLNVGYASSGTLDIRRGATVNSTYGYIGYNSGSSGRATIEGSGSTWNNSSSLLVGYGSKGTLSVTGGAALRAGDASVYSGGLLVTDVGRGSSVVIAGGAGTITNNGTVRIIAGAGVPADGFQYSPISTGSWGGTGTCQPIGGTWNATNHTFTASTVTHGTSGSPIALDLSSVQRALVGDNETGGTGWVVGASFPPATSTMNITFSASVMSLATINVLLSQLPTNESVLSAWTFAITSGGRSGYSVSSNNPLYLSFNVGAGYPSDDLNLWQYNGTAWTPYAATDLTYDGAYVSFTATALGRYAVSGVAVPEPATLTLLAIGLLSLLAYARRRRRV